MVEILKVWGWLDRQPVPRQVLWYLSQRKMGVNADIVFGEQMVLFLLVALWVVFLRCPHDAVLTHYGPVQCCQVQMHQHVLRSTS